MMFRSVYIWLLRMHPSDFRRCFAAEMLEIFDEASKRRAAGPMFADAFLSIFRQWVLRSEFRQPTLLTAGSGRSGSEPVFRTLETYRPRPSALLNGGLLSVIVLCAVAFSAGHAGGFRGLLTGVFHPSPHLFALDRSSFVAELNTQVKFGPEPEDPLRPIASFYFKTIWVLRVLDANQDTVISPWEIFTAPAALRKLDLNHDGRLSPEECGLFHGADPGAKLDPEFVRRARRNFMRLNPVLAALDTDHDGEISAKEIENSAAALKRLDRNGDGSLSANELLPDRMTTQAALILSMLDRNGDGKIAVAELASEEAEPLRELIKSADRNHDGVTTEQELVNELRLREEGRKQLDMAEHAAGLGRRSSSGTMK